MDDSRPNKLNNCPFCGAKDEGGLRVASLDDMSKHAAFCDKCDAQGPMSPTSLGAIQAWNKAPC